MQTPKVISYKNKFLLPNQHPSPPMLSFLPAPKLPLCSTLRTGGRRADSSLPDIHSAAASKAPGRLPRDTTPLMLPFLPPGRLLCPQFNKKHPGCGNRAASFMFWSLSITFYPESLSLALNQHQSGSRRPSSASSSRLVAMMCSSCCW